MSFAVKDDGTGWRAVNSAADVGEGESFSDTRPDVEPTFVVSSVTRFQARTALYNAGLLDEVEALMASSETPMLYKLAWQDSLRFNRNSTTIAALQTTLGLSDSDIDDLFIAAAKITA